jgi:hypothetical protein
MAIRLVVSLAVVALLAATALVMHDSFFTGIGVRPEDAGASDADIVIRGVIYLGLPVGAAAVAATGVLLGLAALVQARRSDRPRPLARVAVATVVLVAAGAAVTVTAVLVPGFISFATGSALRVVGALIIVLAFATVLALTVGMTAGGGAPSLVTGWLALAVMTIAAVPTLLLARSAGDTLAQAALEGARLDPGAFDPLQVRAGPACILSREPEASIAPTKVYVRLGESSAGTLVFDQRSKRAFHVPPDRLGVLGVADEVCRVPGDAVPLEVGTPAEDAALARTFRPLLLFDSREPWRPVNVERLVAETYPEPPTRHQICPARGECQAIGTSADFTARRVRLDLHGQRSDGADYRPPGTTACPDNEALLDCESDASAIYYRVTRQDRRVYIDYWWFLRYNHFPFPAGPRGRCGGGPTPKSQHEGDWEGVTVVTKFDQPRALDYVLYAAHGHSFRYRKLRSALDGQRPQIFVACGSHAAYPRPCRGPRGCRQTSVCRPNPCKTMRSVLAEAPADGGAPWHRNADKECFTTAPCLLAFPTSPSGAADGWPIWSGRWGATHGPRSPARQARFSEPWATVISDRVEFDRSQQPGKAPEQG